VIEPNTLQINQSTENDTSPKTILGPSFGGSTTTQSYGTFKLSMNI
jgi:hypothetical protein